MLQLRPWYGALKKVSEEVGKDASNAKDTATQVQSQMTELAKDVANLKHGQTFQFYLGKFHSAITTLDSDLLDCGQRHLQSGETGNFLEPTVPITRLFLVTKRALPQERSFHPSSALMGAVFGATGGWNCRVCLLPFQAPNSPDRPEHGGSRRMAPFQSKTTFGVQRSSHEPVPDRS